MTVDGPDLFGNFADAEEAHLADFHWALVSRPRDEEAVLRRADFVARTIGPPPPDLGSYDLVAFKELVAGYVAGRYMSVVLVAASVIERHLTLAHRVHGRRWQGTLEEKIERLRDLETPIGFLRPRLRAVVAAMRGLGADTRREPPPSRSDPDALEAWEARLEAEAKDALTVAIFVMTRLPAHLCAVAKGTA